MQPTNNLKNKLRPIPNFLKKKKKKVVAEFNSKFLGMKI